ncbi:MAG: CBS domain-containing protein [Nanoarchaeota archaeon]
MKTIKDIMNKKVIHFDENFYVYNAAVELGKKDIGCVIITRNKKPIGIITERDMVKRVIAKDLDPKKTKLKEVMTSPVESLDQNTNIYYASKIMREKGYQRYPVVKKNVVIGVITQANLIDYFTEQRKKFVLQHLSKKLRRQYL